MNKLIIDSKGQEHIIDRLLEGKGLDEVMTPVCSCGWKGRGYAAYNNWQHTNVQEQIDEHLESLA